MKRRLLVSYLLFLVAGCTIVTNNLNERDANVELRSSPERLRFTVTDIQSLQELQHNYGTLRTFLEKALERKVEFVPFENYIAAAAALQSGQLDFALTGPSEYVVMRARTNVVPVIGITRPKYRSIICVSAQSKIKSLAQLREKIQSLQASSREGFRLRYGSSGL